ncbi:MAG: hypothetical protein RL153_2555 [Verrucomicrobiota bacterium]
MLKTLVNNRLEYPCRVHSLTQGRSCLNSWAKITHPVVTMTKGRNSSRPRMRSWEADEQVAELLDLAVRTTGASLRDIVNEALREHAPSIIRRLLQERGIAEAKLRDLLDRQFPVVPGDHHEASEAFADKRQPPSAK